MALAPVLVISPPGFALTNVGAGQTLNITGTTAPDNYLVRDGGVLLANDAQTFEINVEAGSTFQAVGGTYAGRSNSLAGITVINSQATLTNVAVSGSFTGLIFSRQSSSTTGSTGRVTGSDISGDFTGVSVSGASTVDLIDTRVTGNLADSVGLQFFGGEVRASQNTVISGGEIGVRMDEDGARLGISRLVLDSSSVEGRTGSAIVVDQGIEATIEVLNNSTLLAGNGILLDVQGASTVGMKVADSVLQGNINIAGNSTANLTFDQARLTGNVLADSGSSASVLLQNQSVLEGNVQLTGALGELALDQSTMTGNVLAESGATADVRLRNHALLDGNVQLSGNSTASLTLDQSRMTGDVLVESGSTANVTLNDQSQLIGRLNGVNGVTINSQSTWTLTGNDSIGTLAMSGGTVDFGTGTTPGTFYQLNVGTLTGNGTFAMKGDFANGDRDFLNVSGVATGDFGLAISASGLDATSPQQLQLVHTGAGDARFSLVNGTPVDLGAFSYALTSESNGSGGTDWFLDPTTKTISPGASTVLALFNTAPTVWYGELSSLRSRMGELRFNGGQSGAWARSYGNKYNVAEASGVGYQQTQQGFSLGADARLGESQWLMGVLAGYSQSDLDLNRGTSGTVKSYYAGPYVTWLDADTGYYFDGVLKFNRFRNEAKVSLSDGSRSKGDYDTMGVGASAEFGRHIKLADGYFVEPFTQLSAVVVQGRHYDLDNGMEADGDRTRSLLGKLGTTAGRNIPLSGGGVAQPYVRAAWVHEFAKNNEVRVNDNVFNNDLSGSRGELGAGVAVSLSEKWQAHADFDYANGEHIEQPFGVNIGVRYSW
ncbi:autotransporter outer membrane beta-barrel domain-containing protein [Pseudomonas frederiksbergensis]|nr:autotransporter outer membrane beta-barrel domain-containing protein [Pseudomonas frederiksbergensis]